MAIVKSKLIKHLKRSYPNFLTKDLEKLVDIILDEIKKTLKRGERVELRGFGVFFSNIQKESGNNALDDTQNNYMRQHSSRVQSFATRSSRSNSYQNSGRKSESQSRLRSSRIQSINNSFSGNTLRATRNPSSISSVDDISGRRSAYSASSNFSSSRSYGSSRSAIFGSGTNSRSTSRPVFSSSSSGRSSSGGGYSSGSRSSGRSSGGGAVVSRGGSSGGSSRGRN